jgi:hypothetical protein
MEAGEMTEGVKVDKITESPIFFYKQCIPGTEFDGKFVAFHARDISSIDQGFIPINPDTIEKKQYVCLTLKGVQGAEVMGHYHLDVDFHEIMLRWMSWAERNDN